MALHSRAQSTQIISVTRPRLDQGTLSDQPKRQQRAQEAHMSSNRGLVRGAVVIAAIVLFYVLLAVFGVMPKPPFL